MGASPLTWPHESCFFILTGEDWPGFDVPPTSSDSLWDSAYNPLETGTPWSLNTVDTSVPTTVSSAKIINSNSQEIV